MNIFKSGMSKLAFVGLVVFGLSGSLFANNLTVESIHYMNFRNALADLMGGTTYINMKKNQEGIEELIITNNKSYPLTVRFYDKEAKLFKEYIAIPNSNTYMTEALKPFDNPILVNGKYINSVLDGDLMSSITKTGLTENNLPTAGSINIVLGTEKAKIITMFTILTGIVDTSLVATKILRLDDKLPANMKDILKLMLLEGAVSNQELMNKCVVILANQNQYSNYNSMFMDIKDAYFTYLEDAIQTLTFKYIVQGMGVTIPQDVNPTFKTIFTALHSIELIEKLGKNVLSSLKAMEEKKEILIGIQFYINKSGEYPFFVEDIPLSSSLHRKLTWLIENKVNSIYKLMDNSNSNYALNPSIPISTENFIEILNKLSIRINREELNIYKYEDIISSLKKPNSEEYTDYILLKDALFILYELFNKTYNIEENKIFPLGNKESLYYRKIRQYAKYNYSSLIKNTYGLEYEKRIRTMYYGTFQTIFSNTSELNERLSKGRAIELIYDFAKYHYKRNKITSSGANNEIK